MCPSGIDLLCLCLVVSGRFAVLFCEWSSPVLFQSVAIWASMAQALRKRQLRQLQRLFVRSLPYFSIVGRNALRQALEGLCRKALRGFSAAQRQYLLDHPDVVLPPEAARAVLATYKAGPANVLEPGVWPPGFLTDPPRAPRPEAEAAPEPDSGTARAHGTATVVATPPDEEPPCTPPAAAARPAKTPPSRGQAKAVAAKAAVLKATTQKSNKLQHIKGSVRWKLFMRAADQRANILLGYGKAGTTPEAGGRRGGEAPHAQRHLRQTANRRRVQSSAGARARDAEEEEGEVRARERDDITA